MQKTLLAAAIAATLALTGCQQEKAAETAAEPAAAAAEQSFASEESKVAYGIGRNLGMNLKTQKVELDLESFNAGLKDALDGKDARVSDADVMAAMKSFREKQEAKMKAEAEQAGLENKKEGEEFLAANKAKEGVQTTESGLQYKVVNAGEGAKPSADDTVEVNYRGTFINGEEFDSSYKRGQSVSFPVKGVIAGWTEALQLMPVGAKYELYIPAELAYGPGGTGRIGPNQTLIFEVELLSIKEQTK